MAALSSRVPFRKTAFRKFLRRSRGSHKGDYGKLLILAGSRGMGGAAYLASISALRAGCGLVTLGLPKELNAVMQRRVFEVVTRPLPETAVGTLAYSALRPIKSLLKQADAVCLGPGLSTNPATRKLVHALLPVISCPLLIDADGLNNLAGPSVLLKRSSAPRVITPHPGEMSRLNKRSVRSINLNRVQTAVSFARQSGTVVLLKGHRTVVAAPNGLHYINVTGNPGMATAGSGDVLSGILGAFLARRASSFEAACWSAYIHGLAGDRAARKKGKTSLIARDLIEALPSVFKHFES